MRYGWMILPIIVLAAYGNSLGGSFQYDDEHSIQQNIHLRSLRNVPRFFVDPGTFSVDAEKGMYRPLLLATYAVNYAIGGYDVVGYRLVNIVLHAANACLVWRLARLLGLGYSVAMAAGLLFAVHPVCSEPVNYISSRSESLAGFFYLLGICLFCRQRRATGRGWPVWVALALGLLSKSTVITLPLVLLAYDLLLPTEGRTRGPTWRRMGHHLPLWLISSAYLLVITANGYLVRSAGAPARGPWEQLLTQLKAGGYYLQLLTMPVHLSVEPQFTVQAEISTPVLAALLFAVSLGVAAALLHRQQLRLQLFLAAWGGLSLLPVVVFPLNVLVNERRVYLACAALCIGLAQLLWRVGAGRLASPVRLYCVLTVSLAIVLAAATVQRNRAWVDDMSLWRDALRWSPIMPRVHLYLGNAHRNRAVRELDEPKRAAHWQAAEKEYRRVIGLANDGELSLRALNNLGSVHFVRGEYEAAGRAYQQALEIRPDYADAIVNLGNATLIRARRAKVPQVRSALLEESIALYHRALALRPNHHQAYGNLGVAYQDRGQYPEAQQSFERALDLNPRDWQAATNLGRLHLEIARRVPGAGPPDRESLKRARDYLARALHLNPAVEEARVALGQIQHLLAPPP